MSQQLTNTPAPEENPVTQQPEVPELHPEEGSTIFAKREYTDKKPPRKNGTKKRILSLVACVLGLAVLAGGIFAVVRLLPEENTGDPTSSVGNLLNTQLAVVDPEDIVSIQLQNANDTFTVYPEEVTTSSGSTSSATTEKVWKVEGIDPSLTSSSQIESFVEDCSNISAIRKMNSTSGTFGFDTPTAVLTVKCADAGQDYTITFGKPSADSNGYYAKLGDESVYVVDTTVVSPLLVKATDFANTTVFKAVTQSAQPEYFVDGALANVDHLILSGKNFRNTIRIEDNPEMTYGVDFVLTQPQKRLANNTPITELLTFFSDGLTANGMYSYTLTPTLATQYGLDDPTLTLTAKIGTFEVTLHVGKLVDDGYALQLEGVNAVYKILAEAMPFVNTTEQAYYSPYIFFENIETVASMQFTSPEKDITFQTSFNDKDELTVLHNGQKKSPTTYKIFYRNVLALGVQEFLNEGTAGDPVLTIRTTFNDGQPVSTIRFTDYGNRMCLVTVDGNVYGTIPKSQVTSIITYAQNVVDGAEVPEPAIG